MKNSAHYILILTLLLPACTVRSVTTTTTTPAAQTTTYRTPYGSTAVVTPVSVTKTTETTSLN